MKSELSTSEKKVLTYWGIAAIIVFVVVLLFGLITIAKNYNDKKDWIKDYTLITDRNRYATVNTSLNKYYIFTNNNNKEAVVKILSKKFKDSNDITEKNVENYVSFQQNLNFNSRTMCNKNLSNSQISYLVSGFESNKFTGERLEKKYYQVILDSDNFHFSVTPIDKEDFKGECYE